MEHPPRLFLGNILWNTTQNQIQQVLDKYKVGQGVQHIHIPIERESLSMGSSTRSPLSLMKRRTKWKKLLLSYMIAFWRVSALTQCLPCTPEAGMKENSTRNFQRLPVKADLEHKTGGIKLYLSDKKSLMKEFPINAKNRNRLCSPEPSSKGWGKAMLQANMANAAT